MRVLFEEFHDMLDKIESWDLYQSHNLVKEDIKLYHNLEGSRVNMMATFTIDWSIEQVATLFFEKESIPQWCKLPGDKALEVEHEICPTLYSVKAQIKPDWLPIAERFAQAKLMTVLDPSCNGFMVIVKSHQEDKK